MLADMQTVKYFNLVGDEEDIGNERIKWSRASTFSFNRNAIGPRSAADCLIHSTVDISHPREQGTPPASSSAVNGPVRIDILNGLGAGAVGGGVNPSLVSTMPPGVAPGPVDSASAPPSPLSGRCNYLPTQSQASYHSASLSPSACRPSSGFDGVNEEANVSANAAVVDGHADVRASAVMTHANNDDADNVQICHFRFESVII